MLKIAAPEGFSTDFLESELKRLLKQNNVKRGGRIRINVYRDSDGLFTPKGDVAAWIMQADPLPDNIFKLNKNGLKVGIYKERRLVPDCFSSIKSVNCVPYVLAGIYGREQGWDDCLLENDSGSLMEAVSSNVFLLMGNTYYTPPLSDGCLPGIMRAP